MEFFDGYLLSEFLDFLVSLFVLIPSGILLGVFVWLVSYGVSACFKLLRP